MTSRTRPARTLRNLAGSLGTCLFASSAAAQWPQDVPTRWICTAERMTVCKGDECRRDTASVALDVDFTAMTWQNAAYGGARPLLFAEKMDYGDIIYFSSAAGQMARMEKPTGENVDPDLWDWHTTTLNADGVTWIYYGECRALWESKP